MGPTEEKQTALGSASSMPDKPQQTIIDSIEATEARSAAKRRYDELEERQNKFGSPQSEERNVRRREESSATLSPGTHSRANGHAESSKPLSSDPDSPCSFRTARSTSDHGGSSPSPDKRMNVDAEEPRPHDAYTHEADSQEQHIAQTLSNLADTIRQPPSNSSHSRAPSASSHERQDGLADQEIPHSPRNRGEPSQHSAHSVASAPVTRATLAAAAAAAREAEVLAAAQQTTSNATSSRKTGIDSLAHAINAAQQPPSPNEIPNGKKLDSHSTQPPKSTSASAPLQINPNVSTTHTASTNGQAATSSNSDTPSSMSDIVRVAEAAVRAQKAGSSSQSTSPASASPPPPSASTSASNEKELEKAGSSPSQSPSPALTKNPYAITTQYLKSPTPATPTTPGVPMSPLAMNPYSMYYGPGTPTTPAYPPYANPYYYMTPTMPSPNGIYPPGPSMPTPSASASAPPGGPSQPPQQRAINPEARPANKPKRLKAHTVTSKSFSIPMVPRDKQGRPMLPLNVGIMTVLNLGNVCMREHFHTERYIFPVGYEVTRRYLSTVDPSHEVVYHCTILDGGDGPKFQIIPSDAPDRPVIAGTATGAWSSIVKQANLIRSRQHSNSVSGPDFFGLGQNTIKHLIQELPNARNLRDYVWQNFHEGGPLGGRHAAVIPALPEEYDGSIPVGSYYQGKLKRDITSTPETPKGLGHYPQHVQAEARRMQDRPSQPPVAGPSHLPPPPANGQPPGPPHQPLIHGHSMAEIAQALSNQAQAAVAHPPPPPQQADARQAMQYSDARSQPPVNPPYNPDPGIPPGANPSAQGVPNTFASIMNAFPAGVPPAQ